MLLVASAGLTGCSTLRKQGPIPRSVATCRQYTLQGRSAMERGDWDRAEPLLKKGVDACAIDTDARRLYAEALWHRGAAKEAIAQIEEARRVATEDTSLTVRAGEMYLAMGIPETARQLADQALDLEPKLASAWALRGRIGQAQGQFRQALSDYERSLGYSPGNQDVILQVAEAYRQLNQPERALVALQTLIDTYPPGEEPQTALYLQGLALAAVKRYGDAAETFSLAAQRGQPTAEVFYRLAESKLLAGRPDDAQVAIQKALALDAGHAPSRALLERLQLARTPANPAVQR